MAGFPTAELLDELLSCMIHCSALEGVYPGNGNAVSLTGFLDLAVGGCDC